MQKISLVIIDDHTLIRQSWSFILNKDPRFIVVAESGNAEEGIERCLLHQPNVVLLDINLPCMSGLDAVPLILRHAPSTKVLGVSLHTQPAYVKKMMQNGASGYITKNSSREEMMRALLEVHHGKKYICEEIKNILSENMLSGKQDSTFQSLSTREMQIIDLIKQGLSSKEIAVNACIAVKTVEVHRYNILRKLQLKNSAALVNYINHYPVYG
jgi:DNA-binding NarL/FixJ family response regulator